MSSPAAINIDVHFDKDILRAAQEVMTETSDRALYLTAKDIFARIVRGTPIDTGRARSNWIASVGTANLTFRAARVPYPRGGGPKDYGDTIIRRNNRILKTIQSGQSAFLSNSLPYIRRLEYGWSKGQAPHGMVRSALVTLSHTYKRSFKAAYHEIKAGPQTLAALGVP